MRRLWNDVFNVAQDYLRIPRGTIRATVLIETLPAAFEMEEIIYELRDHSSGELRERARRTCCGVLEVGRTAAAPELTRPSPASALETASVAHAGRQRLQDGGERSGEKEEGAAREEEARTGRRACGASCERRAGLNCGRWDYIFSFIKKLRNHAQFVLPDRSDVGMTSPFMAAYVQLLIKTCHKR